MREATIVSGIALFDAKLATGKYDHYNEQALSILFEDCINQCAFAEEINRRSEAICRQRK